MALGGEIASMFVRIRPNLAGFGAETSAGVKTALAGTDADLQAFAQTNVKAAAESMAANRTLADSYAQIGAAAVRGSDEAVAAMKLSGDASLRAAGKTVAANEEAAASYGGLRRHVLSLGNALGIGFGAAIGVKLVKDVTASAASVQKSIEVIKSEFGASATKVIVGFGESMAQSLGISAELADATSARFGILFKNVGIGQTQAAGMTVGFEKLVGALAAIKGVDPTRVMQNIVLAVAGNTRGLRQLGIAIDIPTEKIAALKLGLISSVKDALTPAIRAQAIYALATANLGGYLDQAKKHSGDYANVQRRLSATWSNAKDIIGTALLPTFTKYTTEGQRWLAGMDKSGKLQRDINHALHDGKQAYDGIKAAISPVVTIVKDLVHWVGGVKPAAQIMFAAFAVGKFAAVGREVRGVVTAVTGIGKAARVAAAIFGISTGAMDAEAIATSATIKAALISTGIGALVVAVGIATVEIIAHWNTVKKWIVGFGNWIKGHAYALLALPIIGQTAFMAVEVVKHWHDIKRVIAQFGAFFSTVFVHPIRAVEDLFSGLEGDLKSVWLAVERDAVSAALTIVSVFAKIPTSFSIFGQKIGFTNPAVAVKGYLQGLKRGLADPASGVGATIQATLTDSQVTHGLSATGRAAGHNIGRAIVRSVHDVVADPTNGVTKAVGDSVAAAIKAAQAKIVASVLAAKNNLDRIGQELAKSVNSILDKIGGAPGSASTVAYQKLLQLMKSGGGTISIARAVTELQSDVSAKSGLTSRKAAIKQQFADLTDEFKKGALTVKQFDRKLAELLKADHVSYAEAGKVLGIAFADNFRGQVKGLIEQASAIAAVPTKYRTAGSIGSDIKIVRPLETIQQQQQKIATLAAHQRTRQIKASERAATAAEKAYALQQRIANTKVGKLPGGNAKRYAGAAAYGHGG